MSSLLIDSSGVPMRSKFYYGFIIDNDNFQLNFKEGAGPELTANLNTGSYTLTDFAEEIQRALNDAGALTFTVTISRSDRILTVAATGAFKLLVSTGTNVSSSPWELMGFTGLDRTGASTYAGNTGAGFEYRPQLWLQNYVSPDDWQQAASASVNVTANGRAEVIKFGIERFVQFQIKMITDIPQGGAIRTDTDALDNARDFMQFVVRRDPFEFMPNENATSTFYTMALDSSPDSTTGTGYRLKELYDQDLPGFFETAVLRFRLRED